MHCVRPVSLACDYRHLSGDYSDLSRLSGSSVVRAVLEVAQILATDDVDGYPSWGHIDQVVDNFKLNISFFMFHASCVLLCHLTRPVPCSIVFSCR